MKKFKLFGNSSQIEDNGACELYKVLSTEEYTQYPYEKCDLDDGMSVINQVIGGYWKPRFLMDERNRAAVEFMDSWTIGSVYCQDRQSKQENPDKIMLQEVTMPNYPS